jgi:tripartite-type tricarboxylate transporter receptor subunit TctC
MNLFRLIKQQWLQQGTTTLLLGLSILLTHPALGQSQDASVTKKDPKNYKILVGFGAGGIPDTSSRMIAPKLAEKMKSTVIVESKLGAGGTLAAIALLAAPADGATLLSVSPAHATAPAIYKKLPYDTSSDFAPITLIGEGPALLVVPNDLNVSNVADLISLAKANPGKLNYSSAGIGSSSHFAVELLKMQTGIDVVHIPYKGVSEALTEVVAGRVQFHITPYSTAIGLVKDGKVKALAVTSKKRLPELPGVPTAAESGAPQYDWVFWYGLLASAKTPPETITLLNKEIVSILRSPDIQKQLNQMGVSVTPSSPDEFKKLIAFEIVKFQKIAKAANIQPE